MGLEPGDVVLVPFPFTDLTSTKVRPVVVISNADYNSASPDVVVLGMTSNLTNAAHSVLVEATDLVRGALPVTSRVKVHKIASIHQRLVRKHLARLDDAALDRVLRELLALLPPAAGARKGR